MKRIPVETIVLQALLRDAAALETFSELIERTSLGTIAARELRSRVKVDDARQLVAMANREERRSGDPQPQAVSHGLLEDEPTEQRMSSFEAAALRRLDAEVAVVDGRPRFHHAMCTHLTDREHEPLPVAEALELGFTPCGRCEPVSQLLTREEHEEDHRSTRSRRGGTPARP